MNFGGSDYNTDIEDLRDLHKPYKIGDKISNRSIADTKSIPSIVNYSHINMATNNFGFGQQEFDNIDIQHYFFRMRELSSKSIFSIKENEHSQEWHLNQTKGKNIEHELRKYFNINNRNTNLPEVFHFALYHKDNQPTADKNNGVKNPRIHFIIGANGIIYPLFYDPYHEINP